MLIGYVVAYGKRDRKWLIYLIKEQRCAISMPRLDLRNHTLQIYTCGTSNVANGIKQACIRIIEDTGHEKEEAERFWNKIQKERFATDVFG